jgi:protein SCO1
MKEKLSNKKFFKGLAVAFVLPLSFFVIARLLSKDKLVMPRHYSFDSVDSQMVAGKMEYDTVFHKIADVVLTNQLGDKISVNKDLEGKMLLINLFFTRCPSICPKLTGNMTIMQKAFRKNDTTVQLLSLSMDPANDTVSVLKSYADSYKANHDHWWFLTGDRNDIYNYARNELKLLAKPSDAGVEELDHSQTIVLVDKDRYIRGYYNGLDTAALKHCADDIILLSLEKKRKRKW